MSYYQRANYKVFINNDSETAAAIAKEYLAYFARFTNFSEFAFKLNGEAMKTVPEMDTIGDEILIECVFGEVVGGHLGCDEIDNKVNELNNGSYALYLYDSDYGINYETFGSINEKVVDVKPEDATCWGTGDMAKLTIELPCEMLAKHLDCEINEVAETIEDLDEECLEKIIGSEMTERLYQDSYIHEVSEHKGFATIHFDGTLNWESYLDDGDAEGFCENIREIIAVVSGMGGNVFFALDEVATIKNGKVKNLFLSNDDARCVMSIVTGMNLIENPEYIVFENR